MIIDSFLYYNEIELLELRLRVLYDYVDKFVIVEGDHTHKGDPIPFRCKNDLKTLGFENDPKIHVIELNLKSLEEEPDPWVRSTPARNAQASLCNDDDIVIIADVDELWHPHYIEHHVNFLNENPDYLLINRCHDLQYTVKHALIFRDNPTWVNAPIMAKGSFWKNHTPTKCRLTIGWGGHAANFPFKPMWLDDVEFGWHLSWMGSNERKLSKINTSCHWRDKMYGEGNALESEFIKDRITNFDPNVTEGDLIARKGYKLQDFDYSELFNIIGDLPHIKDFLLGRNI